MTKGDILTNIDTISPKLQQWITFKEASFEPDELTIVKAVAAAIQPGKIVNWSCSSCAGEMLNIIWAYYQREK